MQADFPFYKFLKIALVTSLFFGLFGSTPGFGGESVDIERSFKIFLFVTSFTFCFWLINITLICLSQYRNIFTKSMLRFMVSCFTGGLLIFIVFLFIKPLQPPREIEGMNGPDMNHRAFLMLLTQGISINIIIFILIELVLLRETKNKVDRENEQLKLANLQAKNSQLQQQLHPHFLFNSLSTLRSLIHRSPEKAADYLEKLADLLRFSTNNSQQTFVLLKEELELSTNYLNMQKVRFGDALCFTVSIPEQLQTLGKVPVYSLQQLAENAIKHNVFTKDEPLSISIDSTKNNQWIEVKNNLQPKAVLEAGTGLGLANLSERYLLLGHEDIQISKTDTSFSVLVKILDYAGDNN